MTSLYTYSDDASRWAAVQSRDPLADGSFVYAVRTTKVFCRPICKARLARRANVSFYGSAALACAAGFRACKRCKPLSTGRMPEDEAVQKIRAFVRDGEGRGQSACSHGGGVGVGFGVDRAVGGRLSLSEMARRTGLSKWHFHRVFKKCVGVTPSEYISRAGEQGKEGEGEGEKEEEEEEQQQQQQQQKNKKSQAAAHGLTMMGLDGEVGEEYGVWSRQQQQQQQQQEQQAQDCGRDQAKDEEQAALMRTGHDSSPVIDPWPSGCLFTMDDVLLWPGDDDDDDEEEATRK